MFNILFVCTGNTCRSCMAEALLKKELGEDKYLSGKVSVTSAGIAANEGEPASHNSVKVLEEFYGIHLEHTARRLTSEMLKRADLVLTMSESHRQIILSYFPDLNSKVLTLKQYVNNDNIISRNLDIEDPFMGDINVYKKCSMEIKEAVDRLIIKLKGIL